MAVGLVLGRADDVQAGRLGGDLERVGDVAAVDLAVVEDVGLLAVGLALQRACTDAWTESLGTTRANVRRPVG